MVSKKKDHTPEDSKNDINDQPTGCCFGIFTLVSILPLFIYGGIAFEFEAFIRTDDLIGGSAWEGDSLSGDHQILLVGFILSMVSLLFGLLAFFCTNFVYHRARAGKRKAIVPIVSGFVISFVLTAIALLTLFVAWILFLIEYAAEAPPTDIHRVYAFPQLLLTSAGVFLWLVGLVAVSVITVHNWNYIPFTTAINKETGKEETVAAQSQSRRHSSGSSSTSTGSRRGFSKMER